MSEHTCRIIESVMPAEQGYMAIVALLEPKTIEWEEGWWIFKKTYQAEQKYVEIPVLFWSTMCLVTVDDEGNERRGNSVMVPMVRMNDSVDAAPNLDGYIAVTTPYDNDPESVPGLMDAIDRWRDERINEMKKKAHSLN